MEWLNRPNGATHLILGIVTLTIRARQAVRLPRLRCRTYWSRLAFRFKRRGSRAASRDRLYVKSLLCPTRSRVPNTRRFVRSVYRTCAEPAHVELLFYVDDDDPQVSDYVRLMSDLKIECPGFRAVELIVGPPMSISKSWNVAAARCSGDLLMMANDDQLYVDYGWDYYLDRYAGESRDGIFALFFEDGQYPPGSGDFPIVSRRWYETLGYFTPGIFEFWYNEAWIFDIARRLARIRRIPRILVDHLHYTQYKGVFDQTYRRHRMSYDKSDRDAALYASTSDQRQAAADKLRSLMIG